MKCYLAGYIAGNKIEECTAWRKKVRTHYAEYKGHRYPIDWLDPLNGKELDTIQGGKKRHMASYERQQRWRNRIEKKQGPMAPDNVDNPAQPPRHDLSAMINETIVELHGRELAVQNAEPAVQSTGGGGI